MTTAPETPKVATQQARDDFAHYVRDAEYGTKFAITRNGKPRALLIPITCAHCGTVIRVTESGTNWVDAGRSDVCRDGETSHEPEEGL